MGFISKLSGKVSNKLGIEESVDPLSTKKRSQDDFLTARGSDALFERTSAEKDGEDCLHDCESCTIRLPRKWSIDEEDKLYGFVKGWSRHILVATGKTDWVRDVEDEKGSVMEAIGEHHSSVTGGKLMLSASNIPVPNHDGDGPYGRDRPTTILLLPAFKWVDNVTPKHTPELITSIINQASTNTTSLDNLQSMDLTKEELPAGLSLRDCPHKCLILLCSQGTRDARCGQSAPLLRRELERQLRSHGLYRDLNDERPGGVGIYFISHVGGHKYSANMMVYRRPNIQTTQTNAKSAPGGEAAQCIWLARVRPEDCENIVRYTVLQGKVVKPDRQLRGGFDREKGVVSW